MEVEKKSLLRDASVPSTKKKFRSAFRFCSNYRCFIKGFVNIAKLLRAATIPKDKFEWSETMTDTFPLLKRKLCHPPMIAHPQFDEPFYCGNGCIICSC